MVSGLILAIAVIILVVVWVMFANLQNRITVLQLQVQALKKRVDQLGSAKPDCSSDTRSLKQTTHHQALATTLTSPTTQSVAINTPNQLTSPAQAMANSIVTPPAYASQTKSVSAQSPTSNQQINRNKSLPELGYALIQWLIRGNPVAKVAIIILFFGLSYLLKYSIAHDLISPPIRIVGSLILGMALLTMGWRLRHKKALYALILQGGAIGILYFTLFAAYKLYAIVPLSLVMILLLVICASSIFLAILQRAISLAIMACIGGYLAPVLLATGSGNPIALFSYYLLISSAILIISFWQSWRILNLIGFLFTFVVATLWGYRHFTPQLYLECQIFIIANMLIYGVLAVLLSIRSPTDSYQNLFDTTLLFSAPLAAFSLQYAITQAWSYAPAFSALGFGLFYLLGSLTILRIWHHRAKQLARYGLIIGLGFTTLAVPLAFSANWTALVWLIEGTLVSYLALTQKYYRFGRAGAIIVLLATIAAVIAGVDEMSNSAFITLYGMMSVMILVNACLWHHYRAINASAEAIKLLFLIIAGIVWSAWIINGIYRVSASATTSNQAIIAGYVMTVWLWFVVGSKINWPTLRYAVIALWPVLLVILVNTRLLYPDRYTLSLWQLSWPVAFISGYAYLYLERRRLATTRKLLSPILHISWLWILLAWVYIEINWLLSSLPWGFAVIKWSLLTTVSGLIVLALFCLSRYRRFPLQCYPGPYWQIGVLPLGLYLIYQLIIGLFSSGQIIGWTYIPLVNPLEESAALAIMALAIYLHKVIGSQSIKQQRASYPFKPALSAGILIVTLLFCWLNSVILRTLSTWLALSWSFYPLWHNQTIQVVLSLVWTLAAVILVVIAHRHLLRQLWFVGAMLQAIVVIKLVFVDSIQLDGLLRAFVFIAVALLMLFIGYLAPLPPRAERSSCRSEKIE